MSSISATVSGSGATSSSRLSSVSPAGDASFPIEAKASRLICYKRRLWGPGLLTIGCVAVVCHLLAQPVPGVGIALPVFVPSLAAAVVALLLSRRQAAPLAYVSGSLGTLIGADLLNLDKIQGLGAPVASIGGAGTFDGVGVSSSTAASALRP